MRQPNLPRPGADRSGTSGTDPLEDLLASCIERIGEEGEQAVESVCREHPAHAEEIRAVIRNLREAGLLDQPGAPVDPVDVPERLGDFRLLRRIGGGGMGVVFLAEQESLGRRVALKLIRPEHLYFPGARERFRREVAAVARLEHPGIVSIHTVGEAGGIPYFAMEWIEGCTLADVLKELGGKAPERLGGEDLARAIQAFAQPPAPRPPGEPVAEIFRGSWTDTCFRVIREVARALHHAHERGIVHRDVKPSNVAVTPDGRVILLDFGLARTRGVQKLTKTGAEVGSLAYMAPEQVRGDDAALGPRTDVYSLGVTLYEILTLKAPYLSETSEVTRQLILEGRPETVRMRNRAVPWDAETVCLKAMERDPARRYASAGDFARDLENVVERRPIGARRPGPVVRARRWVERRPALSTLLVLGLLLVLSSIGFAIRERAAGVEIRRLSALHLLSFFETEAEGFWPANPARVSDMDKWIHEAEALLARRGLLSASLDALRRRARPYDEKTREKDRRVSQEQLDGLRLQRDKLAQFLETTPAKSAADERELRTIERLAAHEERALGERRTWLFDSVDDQWVHDMLTSLVTRLDGFTTLVEDVRAQRRATVDLEKRTIVDAAPLWEEAVRDIAASETYGHLALKPQLGLVPLRKDPTSGLWEFLHVLSGDAPAPDPSAANPVRLRVAPESGIVLVLLPGGTYRMGSELPSDDHPPGSPNVDPDSVLREQPVHPVTLRPFLLSKYELTCGQWSRLAPREEAWLARSGDAILPVYVSWDKCSRALGRVGLTFPTEAQWEYACRAGTTTVFATGDEVTSLAGHANIADVAFLTDETRQRHFSGKIPASQRGEEAIDDGFAAEAPVGSFPPNRFGLYDMLGNVAEHCSDWLIYRAYWTMVPREGDGLVSMSPREGHSRVCRGGSWNQRASEARSAARQGRSPADTAEGVGVRPARPVDD